MLIVVVAEATVAAVILDAAAMLHMLDIMLMNNWMFVMWFVQRPLDCGADMSMHSLTKYMNGEWLTITNISSVCRCVRVLDIFSEVNSPNVDCSHH